MSRLSIILYVIYASILITGCDRIPNDLGVLPDIKTGAITRQMVPIAGGTFTMGSNNTLDNRASPPHQVTLSPFFMDNAEISQAQYQAVMGINPSALGPDTNRPAESMTWYDAVLYCNARSKRDSRDTVYSYTGLSGIAGDGCTGLTNISIDYTKNGYRLPTEAQWEYACRAGTTSAYYWGDNTALGYYWSAANSDSTTHASGQKIPNSLGLYDMSGNVWEWCSDWYGGLYSSSAQTDPTGAASGLYRMIRGGSFESSNAEDLHSAYRTYLVPGERFYDVGFRCVCPVSIPAAPQISSITVDEGSVTVAWNVVSDAVSYNLYYASGATVDKLDTMITGVKSPMTVPGLTNSTTYAIALSAQNSAGESALGAVRTATPVARQLLHITGGSFVMGSGDSLDRNASPLHQVTVTTLYMDSTEVTQADYQKVMGVNPSYITGDNARPVETVTWFDAVLYCNARSVKSGKDSIYRYTAVSGTPGNGCTGLTNISIDYTKNGYRLPTEAEWEYACRAATTSAYYWGQSIDEAFCWYPVNSDALTHPVGQKIKNAFGLYDMSGNVWEWCNDWYGSYTSGAQTDPTGAATGSSRVTRGGSWYVLKVEALRSAYRDALGPDKRYNNIGFRCVRR